MEGQKVSERAAGEAPASSTAPAPHARTELGATWILALRLCILVAVLLSASARLYFGEDSGEGSVEFLFFPLAGLFLLTAAAGVWLRRRPLSRAFFALHFTVDSLLVTAVVYVTGGSVSPFLFLYLALVMVAAIFTTRRTAILFAALSVVLYSSLVLALKAGVLNPADGTAVVPMPSSGLLLQIIGLGSALFLVAVATSFLTLRLRFTNLLVERSRADLLEVSRHAESLMEGYPDAVIITEIDQTVRSLNEAARSILKLQKIELPPERIDQLLKRVDPQLALPPTFGRPNGHTVELEIKRQDDGASLRVNAVCKTMKNGTGQDTALVFFLHDVTKLRSAEERLELQERMARLLANASPELSSSKSPIDDFVGESPVIQKVFSLIERVADSEATVLITGESGTGKELVARAIHRSSKRTARPFVAVNCGAIPETLIESELFGHKKGSFTGAESDAIGLVRQAQGGTLFLDEIGELPLLMQTKLLRVLQERTVRPVGSSTDIPVDVRIVAATNRNLKREVENGRFREDLYYRLNVIGVQLPALRERREDIPLIVNSLLKRLARSDRLPVVAPQAMQLLMNYGYPGNVRELENVIERAVVLGGDAILPEHLPDNLREARTETAPTMVPQGTVIEITDTIEFPVSLDDILGAIEKKYLQAALLEARGLKKRAAELLGMNFRSFRYRLSKYGMADESDASSVPSKEQRKGL